MINSLSSIPFKFNQKVFDFVVKQGIEYGLINDPNYIHPLEEKKKLTSKEMVTLDSFLSKIKLEKNILGLASIFSYVDEFYIPVRMDSRGRVYCIAQAP